MDNTQANELPSLHNLIVRLKTIRDLLGKSVDLLDEASNEFLEITPSNKEQYSAVYNEELFKEIKSALVDEVKGAFNALNEATLGTNSDSENQSKGKSDSKQRRTREQFESYIEVNPTALGQSMNPKSSFTERLLEEYKGIIMPQSQEQLQKQSINR